MVALAVAVLWLLAVVSLDLIVRAVDRTTLFLPLAPDAVTSRAARSELMMFSMQMSLLVKELPELESVPSAVAGIMQILVCYSEVSSGPLRWHESLQRTFSSELAGMETDHALIQPLLRFDGRTKPRSR